LFDSVFALQECKAGSEVQQIKPGPWFQEQRVVADKVEFGWTGQIKSARHIKRIWNERAGSALAVQS